MAWPVVGIILPCSESIREDKQKNLFFLVVGLPEGSYFLFYTMPLVYRTADTPALPHSLYSPENIYISAVRYTNVNGTVHPHLFYTSSFHYTINQFFLTLCKTFNTITQFSKIRKSLNLRFWLNLFSSWKDRTIESAKKQTCMPTNM